MEDLNDSRYAIETLRLSRESSFRLVTKPLKTSLTGFKEDVDFLWISPHHRELFSALSRLRTPSRNKPTLELGNRIAWVPLPSLGLMHLQCHSLVGPAATKVANGRLS
jgi:hypothetical protein